MLPLLAVGMVVLILAAGVAIDSARAYYVRDILQRSLDAAGLAAGNAKDPEDAENDAREFFNANFAAAAGVATGSSMQITIDENGEVIDITGTATLNTTFMSIFGFETLDVDAEAEITRATRGLELVLVMDNTGSMAQPATPGGTGRRIDDMQAAARELVDLVYGDDDENPNLWTAVVPFVATVNVGSSRSNFLSPDGQDFISSGFFNSSLVNWGGCVMAREGDLNTDDTPPNIAGFAPYASPDTLPTDERFAEFNVNEATADFWDARINRNNWFRQSGGFTTFQINNDGSSNADFQDHFQPGVSVGQDAVTRGPNRGCIQEIVPLVRNRQTVLSAIDEMVPWAFGGTTTNLGLAWGWRAISPRWRGLWGSPSEPELPLDYDEPFMDKVIVLLTDGVNELGTTSGFQDFSSYGTLNDFSSGSVPSPTVGPVAYPLISNSQTQFDDAQLIFDERLTTTCENAKAEGVIIYTIGFALGPTDNQIRNLLLNCASNPSFFFNAQNGLSLSQAFQRIGRQLSNLRLSQ